MGVKMRLLEKSLAVQLMALIVCCYGASHSLADPQTQTNEERITKLEAVISTLEKRISALEGSPVENQTNSQSINTSSGWKNKSNWRLLSKSMTKTQVKNILGEPEKINVSGSLEQWYWNDQQGPEVTFYEDRLDGWGEPD
jgi:hypothetical protein